MKKFLKGLLTGALALTLVACGGSGNNTSTTEPTNGGETTGETEGGVSGKLVFWTQDTEAWQAYFNPALERFKAAYPDVNVEVEYFSEFADKLTQSFAANTEAEVIFTYSSVLEWANAGKLKPIPEDVYSKSDLEKTFYTGATASKKFNDNYYGVPAEINVESPTLYVNMTKLEELGVELPAGWIENNGPKDWKELFEFAKSLTVKDASGTITQAGLSYAYAQWEAMFQSLIIEYGGDFRDAANKTVHFDTPEAKKALEFMMHYLGTGEDALCQGTNNRYDEFVQGIAVMCVGAPWYAASFPYDIPDVDYQCFNLPALVEGANPVCLSTSGWGYIVTEQCKNDPAAWEFVKFMTSAEEIKEFSLTTGSLPSRVDTPDLAYDVNVGSVEKAISIAKDVLPYAEEDGAYMLTPSYITYTVIRTALRQCLEDGDIDNCLKTIQSEAETMLAENLGH